jgi:pimeloyl-ACP methyl ester carboxylesterase
MKELKDEPKGLYILGAKDYLFLTLLRKDLKRVRNPAIIKDAGHVCNIDQYKAVNELMVQFLEADAAVLETV